MKRRSFRLLGVALLGLALGCGDGPTPPDDTVTLRGRIVFAVDTGPYPLMSMKPDGSDRRPIPVALPSFPTVPAISPDGRQVAFGLDFSEIYIVNADGTGLRNITNSGALEIFPHWSPDGREIAYSSNQGLNGQYDIYAIRLADTVVRKLSGLPGDKYVQDWSADGQWLLATKGTDTTHGDVWKISATVGEGLELTNDPADDAGGAFSPDGRLIAFSAARARSTEIFVMSADGSNEQPLAASDSSYGCFPRWSPDGAWLVYDDCGLEIWKGSVDGARFANLGRGRDPTWGPAE